MAGEAVYDKNIKEGEARVVDVDRLPYFVVNADLKGVDVKAVKLKFEYSVVDELNEEGEARIVDVDDRLLYLVIIVLSDFDADLKDVDVRAEKFEYSIVEELNEEGEG